MSIFNNIGLKITKGKLPYLSNDPDVSVFPDVLAYSETLYAASVSIEVTYVAALQAYTETLFTPTIIAVENDVTIVANKLSLTESIFTPTIIAVENDVTIVANKLSFTESIFTPTITALVGTIKPDADINAGNWTLAPLWSKVNDTSDTTWITSTDENNGQGVEISLAQVPITTSGTSVLRVRSAKNLPSGTNPDLIIEFRNGTTILHSNTVTILDSINNFILNIPTSLNPSGDYNVRLERSGAGNPSQRRALRVYDIWLTLP